MTYFNDDHETYSGIEVSFPISFSKIIEKEVARKTFLSKKPLPLLQKLNDSNENSLDENPLLPSIEKSALKNIDPFYITTTFYIIETLKRIEDKVDHLLQKENIQETKKNKIFHAHCTRISGGGLIINSKNPLKREDLIKIQIILPEYPPSKIIALAEVLKIIKNSQDKNYTAILKFDSIYEEDRDEVFRYVTNKQRELIRNERQQKEE